VQTETGQIIVQFEGNIIQTVSLTQEVLSIGRTPEAGLTLPHPLISRAHAELRRQAQGVTLTDLGSSNGTFIGNERLLPQQPRILTDGMSFHIGPYTLTYRASKATQERPTWTEEPEKQEQSGGQELPVIVLEPAAATTAHNVTERVTAGVPRAIKPSPRVLSQANRSIYSNYLPDIYQENDFLQRFLYIFEDIWEPLEQRQDHIDMYFDPRTCPAEFLPWLAGWLDLTFNQHWPEARRRRLLAEAMDLYRWRGTRYGLVRMIEICAGVTPVITENPLEPFVFRIRISGPVDRELIEELVQVHKPAHAGYILEVTP
jgi:phage tail-like protein